MTIWDKNGGIITDVEQTMPVLQTAAVSDRGLSKFPVMDIQMAYISITSLIYAECHLKWLIAGYFVKIWTEII